MKKLPAPWRITFDTNPDLCNLHCIMCEEHSEYGNKGKNNRLMNPVIIEKVVSSAVPRGLKEIIPSTMGEPLLYPHFNIILRIARNGNVKMNLTTNGTFPRLGAREWGERILPIASDVKISINGSIPQISERIMKGLNHKKQMQNIVEFIQVRDGVRRSGKNWPTVTFQVTFLESNFPDMENILKKAIDMDADRFKGHHLWITWPELKEESLRRNKEAIYRWNELVKRLKRIAQNALRPSGNRIKLDNIYQIDMNGNEVNRSDWLCPFLGREAWIAWDGAFNVCCSPDDLRQSLGYFGNVLENDFMDLWNSKKYKDLLKNWGEYDVCKECNMRRPEDA